MKNIILAVLTASIIANASTASTIRQDLKLEVYQRYESHIDFIYINGLPDVAAFWSAKVAELGHVCEHESIQACQSGIYNLDFDLYQTINTISKAEDIRTW